MQVPVYWPVVEGVQFIEKSGVVEEVKNVIAIESMPIIVLENIGMEELVELAIAMPDIVLLGAIDIDIELIVDMSMTADGSKRMTLSCEKLQRQHY